MVRDTPRPTVLPTLPSFVPGARGTDPLLIPDQVALMLGVTRGTLEVWRSTRRYPLAFVKVGRLVRYRLSAVEHFIVSRTDEAGA